MRKLGRTILIATVLRLAPAAATPVHSAGAKYFEQANGSLISGAVVDAAAAAEQGWAAVLAAGAGDSGFLLGVHDASRIFDSLGSTLRADAVYTEAETACATPGLQLVKLRLQYMHADRLIRNSEYVKAEGVLRASLAVENSTTQKSSLFVAILQSLAFVR